MPDPARGPGAGPSSRRALMINVAGGVYSAAAALLVLPVYVRALGIEAFGLVGFVSLLQMVLQIFDFGLTPLISRELGRRRDSPGAGGAHVLRSIEASYWAIGLGLGLASALALPAIEAHWVAGGTSLPPDTLRAGLWLTLAIVVLNWPVTMYQGALQGIGRADLAIIVHVGAATASTGGGVIVAWTTADVRHLLAWQTLIAGVRVAALMLVTWRALGRSIFAERPRLATLQALAPTSAWLTLAALLSMVLAHQDRIAVTLGGDLAAFGRYSLAAALGTGLSLVIGPAYQAILPWFAGAAGLDGQGRLDQAYREATQWFVPLLAAPGAVLMLLPSPVLFAWTGDAALAATVAPIVALLAAGQVCNGLLHLPFCAQVVRGRTGIPLAINAAAAAVSVPLVLAAAMAGRLALVAAGVAGAYALSLVVSIAVTHPRLVEASGGDWLRRAVLPGGAAAFAGALPFVWLPAGGRFEAAAVVAAAAFASVAAAVAATPILRHKIQDWLSIRRTGGAAV